MTRKSKNKEKKKKIDLNSYFFAYQSIKKSTSCDNVDGIRRAIEKIGTTAVTWETMKTNGKLINKQILIEIEKATIFVCDFTYLNENVFFELGFAIGKRKPLLILLNTKVKDATQNYGKIDILKGIGYTPFENADDIIKALEKMDKSSILLDQLGNFRKEEKGTKDVFYIKTSSNSQAEIETIEYIKSGEFSQICDDSSEIAYEPLEWYLGALNKCNNLIVHLTSNDKTDAGIDNAKNSLYAGLGYALSKRVLFVAPYPFYAPMDYLDILLEYHSAAECVNSIKTWLGSSIIKKKPVKLLSDEDKELNLLKLGIGYSIAEDEKDSLLSYFVETYAYDKAKSCRSAIFYGRKGTGKTALYIKLCDDFIQNETTYLVALKPESTELIESIHAIDLYDNIASKKTLFHAIWKYVLYSKLINDLCNKVISKKRKEYSELELKIMDFYEKNEELLQLNFMGTLSKIANQRKEEQASVENIIEEYNMKILVPMKSIITEYFHTQKYCKIAILADNLDKAWDAEADLSVQTEMVLSLLEVTGKIQQELVGKKDQTIDTTVILFLRADIYKFVLSKSREPDKLTVASHEIEWVTHKALLKQMVEQRIGYVLDLSSPDDINEIWKEYFDFGKEDPIELVQKTCLPRPRDILLFFGKMFESACNNSRKKVNREDYEYALTNYSNFLYQNLIAEMSAEYPYIRDMIEKFHLKFNDKIDLFKFRKLIKEYEKNESLVEQVIEALFTNEYLIATDSNQSEKYFSYDEVIKVEEGLKEGKGWPFKKKLIYIMQHPRYARVK
jgi:hypothetical protein